MRPFLPARMSRINRIRLEFKVHYYAVKRAINTTVLIESDWNLKYVKLSPQQSIEHVLIESDWNLKVIRIFQFTFWDKVLIESDWNLKRIVPDLYPRNADGINRIRLEFKGISCAVFCAAERGINRIRLEFKASSHST